MKNQNLSRLKNFLSRLEKWALEPFFPAPTTLARRRVRLLASLEIAFAVFSVLGLLMAPYTDYDTGADTYIILSTTLVFVMILYVLSRTRLYRWAILGTMLFMTFFPFATLIGRGDYSDARVQAVLLWLIAGLLLGLSLLSLPITSLVVILDTVAVLLLPLFIHQIHYENILPVLGFLWISSALIFMNFRFRNRVENDRRTELETKNKALSESEAAAQKTASQLAMLNEISRAIAALRDLDSVLEIIRQQVVKHLTIDAFMVCLYDPETQMISFPMMYEDGKLYSEPETRIIPTTRLGRVLLEGKSLLHLRTPEEVAQGAAQPKNLLGDHVHISASILFAPMLTVGKVIGALSAQSYQFEAYTNEDLRILEEVAIQAGIAIENARLFTGLQTELAERRRVEIQIRQLNDALEERVRERTAQLEAANRELESFSYSVSHDLRSPLRGILGYAQILEEDYGRSLDPQALSHLEKVKDSARRMEILIDELLQFSRIGRQSISKKEVNLEETAQEVFKSLREHQKDGRQIQFILGSLPKVRGDPALLRQVVLNLIDNALKYTRNCPQAVIEMNSLDQEGETVVYVRDNGAGFNMLYVDKLFGVFQRLHHADEFEGTGVGLAIVKRIIEKHGGRIWAEGQEGKGATFYFTVGNA